jgi:dTMP kinase
MTNGLLISFEGTEGSGKSTQVALLAKDLRGQGYTVLDLREPGGTGIGEEIRHTLKHSDKNIAMASETELLLMSASRAQLVREVIRPALSRGEIILCDRFYDSTTAYQGYGRGLNLDVVKTLIDFAVEDTHPHLTLLIQIPLELSENRLRARKTGKPTIRDRMEEADRKFFRNVINGYKLIASADPERFRMIDGTRSISDIQTTIENFVRPLLLRYSLSKSD